MGEGLSGDGGDGGIFGDGGICGGSGGIIGGVCGKGGGEWGGRGLGGGGGGGAGGGELTAFLQQNILYSLQDDVHKSNAGSGLCTSITYPFFPSHAVGL
tara:strand:+ start:588 stop:884 length:297 start_codon:yes stop_codon:yes gene_type:complete